VIKQVSVGKILTLYSHCLSINEHCNYGWIESVKQKSSVVTADVAIIQ